MSREFKTVDYEMSLNQTVRLGDVRPPDHLARFIVDAIAQRDLRPLYSRYGLRGGAAYAPEVLLGLLFYGYATGVFSSRKLEQATYDAVPFRFIAGSLHPDHDTVAHFRKTFLSDLKALFVEALLLAQAVGLLRRGMSAWMARRCMPMPSRAKRSATKGAGELIAHLQAEVEELFALAEHADQSPLPAGLDVAAEVALREERLARLKEAKTVLEARAKERAAVEQAAYEAKVREREEKAARTGRRPRGKPPTPPTSGARDDDQYNFTDPESQIMKNPTNTGFDQHYNAQLAVAQEHLFIVGYAVSHHPTDQGEVTPTVESIPGEGGIPAAATLDTGYFSEANIRLLEERGRDPYSATGRTAHRQGWQAFVAQQSALPPSPEASPKVQMAYKLQTDVGRAIYRLRKCPVEPVFGCLKEVHGFRPFSVRGLGAVTGEWRLLCLARNLKRLHTLLCAQGRDLPGAALFAGPAALLTSVGTLCAGVHCARVRADTCWQLFRTLVWVGISRPQPRSSLFSPTGC